MVIANHPVPAGIECFYFEIEIQPDLGRDSELIIAIGFTTQPVRLENFPGWFFHAAPSWGYHGDDGRFFANGYESNRLPQAPYGKGTTIGCGIIYQNGVDGQIFYTKDGESLGIAVEKGVVGRLYPVVGVAEPVKLEANFGDDLQARPFKWKPGNMRSFDLQTVVAKVEGEVGGDGGTGMVPTTITLGSAVKTA
jgi:hypothetical protein